MAACPVEACDVPVRGTVALEDAAPEASKRDSWHDSSDDWDWQRWQWREYRRSQSRRRRQMDMDMPFLSQPILETPQVHVVWLEMDPAVTTLRIRRGADDNSLEFRRRAWATPRDDSCSQSKTRVRPVGAILDSVVARQARATRALAQVEVQRVIVQQKIEEARKEVAAADQAVSESSVHAEVLVEALKIPPQSPGLDPRTRDALTRMTEALNNMEA